METSDLTAFQFREDEQMKRHQACHRGLLLSCLLCAIVLFGTTSAVAQQSAAEGTWRLVSRKLPDGTTVSPPNVMGIGSWLKGYRNLNVLWTGPDGAAFSYSVASTYTFTATEYTETLMYTVFNDPTTGKPAVVNLSGETKSVPVKAAGRRVELKLPFDLPAIVVEGDTLMAIAEGVFVDYWERVK
jgi:hypothetical protein